MRKSPLNVSVTLCQPLFGAKFEAGYFCSQKITQIFSSVLAFSSVGFLGVDTCIDILQPDLFSIVCTKFIDGALSSRKGESF